MGRRILPLAAAAGPRRIGWSALLVEGGTGPRRIGWRALLFVAAATGCGSLGFEANVKNKEAFDPPEVYRDWWAATERCATLTGDFGRLRFYLADGIVGDGLLARGRWSAPHEIVIVRGYEDDPFVVRHEMLHDLLAGDRAHADTRWDGCGLRTP